jgi:hypothetical protein
VTKIRAYIGVIDLSGANEQLVKSYSENDLKKRKYTEIQLLKGQVKFHKLYIIHYLNNFHSNSFKEWETVIQLFNHNQSTVVLENLTPLTNYSVRAVIVENDGQNTTHELNEALFTTTCVARGIVVSNICI